MSYDLFVSYARQDNQSGRVSDLLQKIQTDYSAFAGEELNCFFDLTDIKTMDDWRDRILGGLRESHLLLLVLSPAYLASPYCEWEIVEFLKYEHSRAVQGQGVAQIYFVEIPGLDTPGFEQQAAAWLARVRHRNHCDLRPWFDEGSEALKRADVRERLADLERSLHDRLTRLRRIERAPGNLPAHNPRFVGRQEEMQRLHQAAGRGAFGVLTAVHGVGGLGKTALAIQYAYSFADFYPGGRWLIGCAGKENLATAIRSLDVDLGLTLEEDEKRDDTRAAKRILAELEKRANAGAQARAGEKDPPEPCALLLLDNVDSPALLQPPQADLLTGRKWLHVLATTRLGPKELGADPHRHQLLAVDNLPEEDALRLIESYQPRGRFASKAERAAAAGIVKLLGGFTLAVEVVAVHLGERVGRVTCADFLQRLQGEGLVGLETAAKGTAGAVAHDQKLISLTLEPTLKTLSTAENLVLTLAALLPPDCVPLPWLRAVAAQDHPELAQDAPPGHDDPWLSLVNHLISLRLLQVIELADDGRTPRICRIHRLVAAQVVERHPGISALEQALENYLTTRTWGIYNTPTAPKHWELDALIVAVPHWLAAHPVHDLANAALFFSDKVLTYLSLSAATPLLANAHSVLERLAAGDPANTAWQRDLSVSFVNLGNVAVAQGDLPGALRYYTDGKNIAQRLAAGDPANTAWQRDLSVSFDNLGDVAVAQGDLPGALRYYTDGKNIAQRLAAGDPANTAWQRDLSVSFDNLGDVAVAQGDLPGALRYYTDGKNIAQRLAAGDPANTAWQRDLSVSFYKLGDVAVAQDDLPGALRYYTDGKNIRQRLAAGDPANTAWRRDYVVSHWKIANAHERAGNKEAMEWWRKTHDLLSSMKNDGLSLSAADEQTLVELGRKIGGV